MWKEKDEGGWKVRNNMQGKGERDMDKERGGG